MTQSDRLSEKRDRERQSPGTEREGAESKRFKEENAEAFDSLNAWVEENGLPLSRYRQF